MTGTVQGKRRKIDTSMTIKPNKGNIFIAIDLLNYGHMKTSREDVNDMLNLCNTTSSVIIEIDQESSAPFFKRLKYHLKARKLECILNSDIGSDAKMEYAINLSEYNERLNLKNISKLQFLMHEDNENFKNKIKKLLKYREVGSFGLPTCFLCKEDNVDIINHGACRKIIDDVEICCGSPNHMLFYKILAGKQKIVVDPLNECRIPDSILISKSDILQVLFERPQGVSIRSLFYFLHENFTNSIIEDILSSLAPSILYSSKDNSILHYKYSYLYFSTDNSFTKISGRYLIDLYNRSKNTLTTDVKTILTSKNTRHAVLKRVMKKRKREEVLLEKNLPPKKKLKRQSDITTQRQTYDAFFKDLISRRCVPGAPPLSRNEFISIKQKTDVSVVQIKRYISNHHKDFVPKVDPRIGNGKFNDCFSSGSYTLGCGFLCGDKEENMTLCRKCKRYKWHQSCITKIYKKLKVDEQNLYASNWFCPICEYNMKPLIIPSQ